MPSKKKSLLAYTEIVSALTIALIASTATVAIHPILTKYGKSQENKQQTEPLDFKNEKEYAAYKGFPPQTANPDESHPDNPMQQKIREVIRTGTPATVAILRKDNNGVTRGTGSGVVVTPEGLIITAAHIFLQDPLPQEIQVAFPNGRTAHAKILGAHFSTDIAALQITDPGTWPFASISKNNNPAKGDPVIAIGNAKGYDPNREPTAKFGKITGKTETDPFYQTNATIIGGDSGGPLFNLEGEVIAIHSFIGKSISQNHHSRIENFTKNEDKIKSGKRWGTNPLTEKKALAGKETTESPEKSPAEAAPEPALQIQGTETTIPIWKNNRPAAAGCPYTKNRIITKWSLIRKGTGNLSTATGTPLRILRILPEYDVAILIPTDGTILEHNTVWNIQKILKGEQVTAQLSKNEILTGIINAEERNTRNSEQPYLGIEPDTNHTGSGVRIIHIHQGSPAAESPLKKGDIIAKINGRKTGNILELQNTLGKTTIGETLLIEIQSQGKSSSFQIKSGTPPSPKKTPETPDEIRIRKLGQMGVVPSDGPQTYPSVMESDILLKADQIGGAVTNIRGEIIGMSISRRDRATTLIIPAKAIIQFME